jgi:hypothetical protein
MPEQRVFLAEMNEADIPFLYQLWGYSPGKPLLSG